MELLTTETQLWEIIGAMQPVQCSAIPYSTMNCSASCEKGREEISITTTNATLLLLLLLVQLYDVTHCQTLKVLVHFAVTHVDDVTA